jgi:integrase
MLLSDALEGWILSKRTEIRAGSVKKYEWYMLALTRWEHCPIELEALTPTVIRKLLLARQQSKWKPATLDTFYRALHGFLGWCVSEDILRANPMVNVKRPKLPKVNKPILSEVQLALLMKIATKRDRTIMHVLLCTAVRRKELCAMCVGDIDFSAKTINLRDTKGGIPRLAYMDSILAADLWHHLKDRLDQRDSPLFYSEQGGPLTGYGVQSLFVRLSKLVGFHVNCHQFRHTAITFLFERGVNTELVRSIVR